MVTLQWAVLCVWGSVSFPPQRRDDSDEEGSGNLTRTAMALGGPLCSAGCPVIFYPGLAGHTHSRQQGCQRHTYTSKQVRRQVIIMFYIIQQIMLLCFRFYSYTTKHFLQLKRHFVTGLDTGTVNSVNG